MQISNRFQVDAWCAWVPGIEEHNQDWQGYFAGSWSASDVKADVGFLPAMQRRRLSPLARSVVYALHHCGNDSHHPMIFCTRYGEVVRTDEILRDLANEQDLSPTSFGLSVYNAIAGQVSIMQKNTQAMSNVVPQGNDYLVAFADALGQLKQGATAVTLVFYEEPQNEFQAPYCFPIPSIIALAVKISLSADEKSGWQLNYQYAGDEENEQQTGILELLEFFATQQSRIQLGHWIISE